MTKICPHELFKQDTHLSKKEMELVKLRQSDALKSKQIMNLEYKLHESLKVVNTETVDKSKEAETENDPMKVHTNGGQKINVLEGKVSLLESQLGSLVSRMDTLAMSAVVSNNNTFHSQ